MPIHPRQRLVLAGLLLTATSVLVAWGSAAEGEAGGIPTVPVVTAATDAAASDGTATDGTATDGTAADGGTTGSADAPTDPSEAAVLFDRCMVERNFPTDMAADVANGPQVITASNAGPSSGADDEIRTEVLRGPGGIEIPIDQKDEFDAAIEVCDDHLANVEMDDGEQMTAEDEAAMQDAMLEVQHCMQDRGYDIEIAFSTGDAGVGVEDAQEGRLDTIPPGEAPPQLSEADREAMELATKECTDEVFANYPDLEAPPTPGDS